MTKNKNIPVGYKDSPVGVIPEDWVEGKLEDSVIDMKSGLSRLLSSDDIGLPVIRSNNLINSIVDFKDLSYWYKIDPQGAKTEDYYVKDGDILVNFINSFAQIGKAALFINRIDRPCIYTTNLLLLRLDESRLNSIFFLNLTNTHLYYKYIYTITKPAVNQASFTTVDFRNFKFALPPLSEQKKIAEILSTWDDAIEAQSKLVDKLKLRKQALMQQLLTGKKRIKGFDKEWKEYRLGEITKKISRRNKDLINARVYSVTNTNGFVYQSDHFAREVAGEDLSSYKIIKQYEFAYNPARINVGSIAYFKDKIGIISSLYVCFSTTNDILDYYLEQLLKLDHTKHKISSFGEGGVRIYLWYELFSKIKVKIPPVEEQTAIANILSTADKEIEIANVKLDKLRGQKKGLMQQLLTGKKRVKLN